MPSIIQANNTVSLRSILKTVRKYNCEVVACCKIASGSVSVIFACPWHPYNANSILNQMAQTIAGQAGEFFVLHYKPYSYNAAPLPEDGMILGSIVKALANDGVIARIHDYAVVTQNDYWSYRQWLTKQ